jgi:hypothetical protein
VLAVSAHDRRGDIGIIEGNEVAAIGQRTVHVAAPGVDILSSYHTADDAYTTTNGTSFAAPYVAGVAALMMGSRPWLTPAQVADRITNSAVALPSFKNQTISEGRLDAFKALTEQPSGQINATVYAELKDGLTAGKPSRVVVRLHDLLRITDATASIKIGDLPPVPMAQDVVHRQPVNPLAGALATPGLYAATITPPKGATELSIELSISAPGKQTLRKTVTLPVVTRPDNDDFADRVTLQGDEVSADGTTVAASREVGDVKIEANHLFAYSRSVWYSWVAPKTGKYQVALDSFTRNSILFTNSVDVFTGSDLGNLQRIIPQPFGPNQEPEVCFAPGQCQADIGIVVFDAVAGTRYPIAVANDFSTDKEGIPFQLKIAPFVMPK